LAYDVSQLKAEGEADNFVRATLKGRTSAIRQPLVQAILTETAGI
jgi:hypothetical protein